MTENSKVIARIVNEGAGAHIYACIWLVNQKYSAFITHMFHIRIVYNKVPIICVPHDKGAYIVRILYQPSLIRQTGFSHLYLPIRKLIPSL